MTAVEIINEIKHLAPAEKAEVARYVRTLDHGRQLTPDELGDLAGRLVEERDPVKAERLKEEIIAGFYGDPPNA